MILKTRYLLLMMVLGLSLGLVTVTLAAADTARGGFVAEAEIRVDAALLALGNMHVNYAHDWVEVEANPSEAVTVTIAGGYWITGTADGDGWFRSYEWSWIPENPSIDVGDVITAETGGLQSTVDPVGEISIEPNFDTDIVSGIIEASWFNPLTLTVSCEIWEESAPPNVSVTGVNPDGGSYSCDFTTVGWDLQPGQMIAVRYWEPDDDSVINIYESPWMRVNYAHDWVGGNYEIGHTFWLTVTESDGLTIKATAEVDTWSDGGWGGEGFETTDTDWAPNQPDIQAGDWVFFQSDDGYQNSMRVGDINGTLDIEADSIGGPIYAYWLTETLDVVCGIWVPEDVPEKESTAEPDGSVSYFCQWDPGTEWDILPGNDVAVVYQEPDGDRVINVFREPSPDLRIEKWAEGSTHVMPGGPVVYTIRYVNDGDGEATTITLTDTLPLSTTYASDTSGVTPTVGAGWVSWSLGPLAPGEEGQFQLVLSNTANHLDYLYNVADVFVEFDSNLDNNHAGAGVLVYNGVPDLYVSKEPLPGDPTSGQTMLWEIDYGNNNLVASGMVVFTDTLPENTTVMDWYSESGYAVWSDYVSSDDQFVITAPSIPGQWSDRIILRLLLSDTIPIGTQMTNTVEIFTAEEISDTLDDNWYQYDDVWVSAPRWDGTVWKDFGWGQLVPGGEVSYHIRIRNHGNITTDFWLTDTLPVGTTFVASWIWVGSTQVPYLPDNIDVDGVYWDIGDLEPGEWFDLEILLQIDGSVAPGSQIENCAEIAIDGNDSWPVDNTACVEETVQDFGPNLRVTKDYWWDWEGAINYELRVENIGTEWLGNLIWITDTHPLSTTYDHRWVNYGSWSVVLINPSDRQVVFLLTEIQPGETASAGFTAALDGGIIGDQGLAFTNTLEAPIPGDVNPDDNYDEVTAYTGPDVYIEKWLSGGELRPGEIITFTVEFGNQNFWPWDGDPGYGSHITETLPDGMSFITATAPWDPNASWVPEIIDGNTIVWAWGPMWSEATWRFDLVVQIADTVEGSEVLTNRIEVYGDSPDDVEYNWDNNVFLLPLTIEVVDFPVYLPLIVR